MAPNGDQRYRTQEYAGDQAVDVQRGQRNMPQEDRSTHAEIERHIAHGQVAALAPQVAMGSDRVINDRPNWDSFTSTVLYTQATEANSPTTADALGRGFNEGGNRLAEAANRLFDTVTRLESAWQGEAADAARGALAPLATSTGNAGVTAQYMGAAMSQQAAAATEVKRLPPPQEFDAGTELTRALANPNPIAGLADMAAKSAEAKAVKQEQVAYLATYTGTLAAIDASTPSFVPPPPGITGDDGDGGFRDSGGVDYRGGGHDLVPRGGPGVTDPAGLRPGGPTGPGTGSVSPVGGGSTGVAGFVPGSTPTPGGFTPPGGGLGGGGTPSGPGAGMPGFGGLPGTGGIPAGGRGGSASGGRGGVGGFDGRGGVGTGGPGGADSGRGGPGSRAGVGGGMGPGDDGLGRGRQGAGAGAGGRGGMGAGGGMGGGAPGEEDLEHQRPAYLIEPDPEDTFGTDQITAPPVIGG
ncbi:hypothetical protein [Actinokineospora sp.]|uniref:hypothetical protein n=1 Tax=Actinokineospora sp. TaxID=1872133 RepID=UPI0040380B4E